MVLAADIALLLRPQSIGNQVVDGVAADIAISRNLLATGAQELVDGQAGMAAGQIPQHAVDQVDRLAPGVKKTLRVPQLLPYVLAVKDVSDQRRLPNHEVPPQLQPLFAAAASNCARSASASASFDSARVSCLRARAS